MQNAKSRPISEYSIEELKYELVKNCNLLEKKARIILAAKPDSDYETQSSELQQRIKLVEEELMRKQRKRNDLLRQVRNMKALTPSLNKMKPTPVSRPSSRPLKSRSNLLKMLNDAQSKTDDPRFGIAIKVLKGELDDDLYESLSEYDTDGSIKKTMARRSTMNDYQANIVSIQQEIDTMGREYRDLITEQEDISKGFKENNEMKRKLEKDLSDIQIRIRNKESELQQAKELEGKATFLRNEIKKIEDKNSSTENDQKKKRFVQDSQEVMRMTSDINEIDNECKDLNKKIAELEKIATSTDLEEKKTHQVLLDAQKNNQNIAQSGESVKSEIDKLRQETNIDPVNNTKFEAFLVQMESKQMSPRDVMQKNQEKQNLEGQIKILQSEIEMFEQNEQDLYQQIQPKKDKINQLENMLKNLASKLDNQQADQIHQMPEFSEGAPSIVFSKKDVDKMPIDQTAIIIYFKEFILDKSFIGKKPSEVYLVVDLLEHESMTTNHVDIMSGVFNSQIMFECKNDFFLAEFLERTSATAQLYRERESQVTEAARTELNLLPFVRGYTEMTQTVPLWNKLNKYVGKVTFEARILRPPNKQQKTTN